MKHYLYSVLVLVVTYSTVTMSALAGKEAANQRFQRAVANLDYAGVEKALQDRANVNYHVEQNMPPLVWLASRKDNSPEALKLAELLIANRVNINDQEGDPAAGYSALHYVIENQNYPFTDHLIKAGADINIMTADMLSPLEVALRTPNVKLLKLVLAANPAADPANPHHLPTDRFIFQAMTKLGSNGFGFDGRENLEAMRNYLQKQYTKSIA